MLLFMASQRVGQDLATEQQLNPSDVRTTETVGCEAEGIVSALWEFKVMENSRCWGRRKGIRVGMGTRRHQALYNAGGPTSQRSLGGTGKGRGDARQSVAKQGPHPSSEVRRPSLCSPDSEA